MKVSGPDFMGPDNAFGQKLCIPKYVHSQFRHSANLSNLTYRNLTVHADKVLLQLVERSSPRNVFRISIYVAKQDIPISPRSDFALRSRTFGPINVLLLYLHCPLSMMYCTILFFALDSSKKESAKI